MDDVYFSLENGLAEARAVFLAGCDLPGRWLGASHFTVAELGFGTGLNLLALWQMWRAYRPARDARLDFVSFEGFPLSRDDAARALARWPELSGLSEILLKNWPVRARGIQRIALADGVTLTLHIDDISRSLPESRFQANAWFLDGFAPAKNATMWAADLYPLIMARCAPGARVGTYTVAGAVRRGLAEAGFDVSKQPGFGRKRDRLQAISPATQPILSDPYSLNGHGPPPETVAIIGAGIAGVCAAHAFSSRGANVTVFDRADHIAAGASGNPLALLMPRLDAGDTGVARVLLSSYLAARALYNGLPGAHPVTVHQRARDKTDEARFAKLLTDPPFAEDMLTPHPAGGLAHHGALILEPAKLMPALIGSTRCLLGHKIDLDLVAGRVNGQDFDLVLLANGMGLKKFPETAWLPLTARLGQVETGYASEDLTSAIASGHYALAVGHKRLWGATFMPSHTQDPVISAPATAHNNAALSSLRPADWVADAPRYARAGLRATTPDKLPFAGPAPDLAACHAHFETLRGGRHPTERPINHARLFLMGGLGARGFTFAPALANHLTAIAYTTPLPFTDSQTRLISPMRFLYRDIKRGRF